MFFSLQVQQIAFFKNLYSTYCNDRKFSDRQVWANSVDSDQTAGSTLFAILSASFGLISLW